jgi:nitrite reductase (NADH) large subunit
MKVVIIGNGIAGVMSANYLRGLEPDADKLEIHIYARDRYPYYARIRLPEIFGFDKMISDLQIYKEDWYEKKSITVHYECEAVKILPSEKKVQFSGNRESNYDRLILACGSDSNIPDIKNNSLKGIFKVREYSDALAIKNHIEGGAKKAVVIGGGLLGIETARFLKKIKDVTIIEVFPRLLPRQLDDEGSSMLCGIIENLGINIRLNSQVEEFQGTNKLERILFKDGNIIEADTAVFSMGIKPRISLAKDAGLATNRGLTVNSFLQSSDKDIYAAGDVVEYQNIVWGIIPAALEHANIVAQNIVKGNTVEYRQTTPKTTLKIADIDLTSIGKVILTPEENAKYDVIIKKDLNKNIYEKYVLQDGILIGSIVLGDKSRIKWSEQNINKKVDKNSI